MGKVKKEREKMRIKQSFGDLYCAEKKIETENFEASLLRDLLPPAVRPLARAATFFDRQAFSDEETVLSSFRSTVDRDGFEGQLIGLQSYNHFGRPLWKTLLGLRVSPSRARKRALILDS
jgi:hypothetical protein